MNDCDTIRERMPAAVHGLEPLTDAEREHLASCLECAAEWRLVSMGAALHADATVDGDRVARRLIEQLRTAPVVSPAVRRLPWRAAAMGLLAVAACALLLLALPRTRPSTVIAVAVAPDSVELVLPELSSLDDTQLQALLQSIGPVPAASGDVPRLSDLTDTELQQLLSSEGGE